MTDTAIAEITLESTKRSVKTKSWDIEYYEAGEGYPVIMLHGSGPGATGWSNFSKSLQGLSDRFRIIAPDMPGWGGSSAVTWEERDHSEALLEFMDELGIEKAAIVGNSMGGMTALRFSVDHNERISHLITMGPGSGGPGLFQPNGPSEGIKVLQQGYRDPSPEGMRALVNIMTFKQAFATPELMQLRSDAATSRPDHIKNYLDSIGKPMRGMGAALWEGLVKVETPALLIHGREDRVVHFENSLRLVQLLPNARMVLFSQVGHWAMNEVPEEFNRLVADFVANN